MALQAEFLGDYVVDGITRLAIGEAGAGGIRGRKPSERKGGTVADPGYQGITGAVRVAEIDVAVPVIGAGSFAVASVTLEMADDAVGGGDGATAGLLVAPGETEFGGDYPTSAFDCIVTLNTANGSPPRNRGRVMATGSGVAAGTTGKGKGIAELDGVIPVTVGIGR